LQNVECSAKRKKIPREQFGFGKLRNGLKKEMNGDELDAISGALTGLLYLQGKAEVLGNFKSGAIVIPKF
jgi:predicted RNase H-like nuclease